MNQKSSVKTDKVTCLPDFQERINFQWWVICLRPLVLNAKELFWNGHVNHLLGPKLHCRLFSYRKVSNHVAPALINKAVDENQYDVVRSVLNFCKGSFAIGGCFIFSAAKEYYAVLPSAPKQPPQPPNMHSILFIACLDFGTSSVQLHACMAPDMPPRILSPKQTSRSFFFRS